MVATGPIFCPCNRNSLDSYGEDPAPVFIEAYKLLDHRTVLIRLGTSNTSSTTTNDNPNPNSNNIAKGKTISSVSYPSSSSSSSSSSSFSPSPSSSPSPFPIDLPPGSHLALTLNGVVREYTPITSTSPNPIPNTTANPNPDPSHNANPNPYSIELIIRLVPNGQFSAALSSSLKLEPFLKLKNDLPLRKEGTEHPSPNYNPILKSDLNTDSNPWVLSGVPVEIYGPLFPLPSKFTYRPYYGDSSSYER
jgi:hypothetical protein